MLAFVQQMRTERHDAIARLEIADDRSRFAAEAGDVHGTPSDARRFPFDQPYAGTLARIEDRADRYLQRRRRPAVRDLDGDGRAERRVCQTALQHVPSLERPSLTVRGVRQLAKCRRARQPASIQGRPAGGSDRRAQGFGELDDRLAAPGMRHTHDDLAGTDDVPGSARVSTTTPSASSAGLRSSLVAGHVGPGLGRIELRSCRLGGSLGLVIGRCRTSPRGPRSAVSHLVIRGLGARALAAATASSCARMASLRSVGSIRMSGWPRLTVCPASTRFQDLPGDSESQVALHAGRDDSGERTL